MADKSEVEILKDAIDRNLAAVLSLPSAGMLRHHKSRFIMQTASGILMEAPSGEEPLLRELTTNGTPTGVSFRSGAHKVMFAAPVLKFEKGFQINSDTAIDAVLLKFPEQVKAVQRRTNYRVEVSPGSDVSIRVWRLGPGDYYKEQPSSLLEVTTELRDMSIGGAGVRFIGRDGEPPKISVEDRLRIQISSIDVKLVMEGQMRATISRGPTGDKLVSGVIFKKLQNDLEGRKILAELTRIVGELQRDELRRIRLGLAKSA